MTSKISNDYRITYTVKFDVLLKNSCDKNDIVTIRTEICEKEALKSRYVAFEQFMKIKRFIKSLERENELGYLSSESVLERKYHSYDGYIYLEDKYKEDNNTWMHIIAMNENEFVDKRGNEYKYYLEQGIDVGETEEVYDDKGESHVGMKFYEEMR